uniref:Uncharacterized protein AlNc14C246G9561 n=1 Tax=Albugo laibachii Nc14 TaxID=890382 RepID=F0WT76_9STRA|nr:conserved hypothetical protein [Albugo laibachii Nc14]|eukprot:CCA24564.1 conserved hypothetical protein [Albugo laibachii Nc14]
MFSSGPPSTTSTCSSSSSLSCTSSCSSQTSAGQLTFNLDSTSLSLRLGSKHAGTPKEILPQDITLEMYQKWPYKGLRPGISIRIIRAVVSTTSMANTTTEYTLHVTDPHTQVFWSVKKLYRDFAVMRQKMRALYRRAMGSSGQVDHVRALFDLPFPKRQFRFTTNVKLIEKKREDLDFFVRNVAALQPNCELHVAILQELQDLVCSKEFATSLENIDTSEEPVAPKWLSYNFFSKLNSYTRTEGQTCYKLVSSFRQRVNSSKAFLYQSAEDTSSSKTEAETMLRDLRNVLTTIESYIVDHMTPAERTVLADLESDREENVSRNATCGTLETNSTSKLENLVHIACEDTILIPLERQISALLDRTVDQEKELKVATNIARLREKTQQELGIPEHLRSEDGWGKSCHHLSMMDEQPLAAMKIQELLASALEVFRNCGGKCLEWGENSALTADDYLPIHIYVVVHCGLKQPWRLKEYLGAMIHPSKMLGETGYFLTMFEVALNYIANL